MKLKKYALSNYFLAAQENICVGNYTLGCTLAWERFEKLVMFLSFLIWRTVSFVQSIPLLPIRSPEMPMTMQHALCCLPVRPEFKLLNFASRR